MSSNPTKSRGAARFWPLIKLVILAVVLVFITQRAIQLWKSTPTRSISVNVLWLIPAGLVYFVGWLPSVWLWKSFMQSLNQRVDWWTALRAYYVSHLGKYVPGKTLALVIRGAMIEGTGASPLLAGMTGLFETLVYMATGAAIFVAISPMALEPTSAVGQFVPWSWCRTQPVAFGLIVAAVTFATTPMSAWCFTGMCHRIMARNTSSVESVPPISPILIAKGVFATAVGWVFHSLSLGFVLQSVSSASFDIAQFPMWMAASTFSLVGGFVILIAPGGLGVREGLLIEVLKDQPQIGAATAIIVAALLRATWFVTELIAAGVLFIAPRIMSPAKKTLEHQIPSADQEAASAEQSLKS